MNQLSSILRQVFVTLAVITVLGAFIAVGMSSSSGALSGSQFNASNIIDDSVFFNRGSMSASDIQAFLNAKVPTCDTNGTQPYAGTTRATYGASRGYPAPYTCLKDYTQAIPAKSADAYCSSGISAGTKSAAQIIYDVSQACGVSPKVLIVLLQKEQSLVTDDWPWSIQYRSATGFGCPDTAACDSAYYGYFNQVYNAARQYQRYIVQADYFNYAAGRTSFVSFQANAPECGGTNLTIQNNATAGLYNYTPYQPNAAALANLYGTGDNCSAYGNRNFWRMFNDWFGTTVGAAYYAAPSLQSPYPSINPGQSTTVYMNYKNWGSASWYDDISASGGTKPVHLATSHNLNRTSLFSSGWPTSSRPALNFAAVFEADGTTLAGNQHVVQPGQIARFSFSLTVPNNAANGTYREFFQPVVEGVGSGAFNDTWTFFDVTVNASPALSSYDQSGSQTVNPGSQNSVNIRFRNTGNTLFYDDQSIGGAPSGSYSLHLATSSPLNRSSSFSSGWPTSSRPALNFAAVYNPDGSLTGNQHVVGPGQIVKFSFNLSAIDGFSAGSYTEAFQPILEGTGDGGLNGISTSLDITVPSIASIKYTPQPSTVSLISNNPTSINITIKNAGNTTLPANTRIVTPNGSAFRSSAWVSDNVITTLNNNLAPLQSRTITLSLLSPDSTAWPNTPLNISLQDQSNQTISQSSTTIPVSIAPATYSTTNAGQSVYPTLTYGQSKPVYFMYKNSGNQYWYDDTSFSSATTRKPRTIHLATDSPMNRSSKFVLNWPTSSRPALNFAAVFEADGTTLAGNQHVVGPGQIVKFSFIILPSGALQPGVYREFFQPVVEGTADGLFPRAWTFIDVTVLKSTYIAKQVSQSPYPTISKGQQAQTYINFRNTGAAVWYDDTSISGAPIGTQPVHLGTSHNLNRSSSFSSGWPTSSRPALNFAAVFEADGTTLAGNQHVVQPGQIARFSFSLTVPNNAANGTYREFFQPVVEGTADGLFDDVWTSLVVTVP